MSINKKLYTIVIFTGLLLFFTFYLNAHEVLSDMITNTKDMKDNNIVINDDNGSADLSDKQALADTEIGETTKSYLEETIILNPDGKKVVNNPLDILVLVNKERSLPANFVPDDLVKPNIPFSFAGESEKKYLRKEAALALEKLFTKAEVDKVNIKGVSGYRSYNTQATIFAANVKRRGEEQANTFSARPGESEHQTGLAIDISSPSVGYKLVESLGEKPEGKWLGENASNFGFIIRYLKDKTEITGYIYEPWHLRYVGVEAAQEISSRNITLEEYLSEK